jgi:hypothetical protein
MEANYKIVYCISRVEIEFSTRGIHDIFPTTTKKTLILGIPSNFKYYSTHRLEGI